MLTMLTSRQWKVMWLPNWIVHLVVCSLKSMLWKVMHLCWYYPQIHLCQHYLCLLVNLQARNFCHLKPQCKLPVPSRDSQVLETMKVMATMTHIHSVGSFFCWSFLNKTRLYSANLNFPVWGDACNWNISSLKCTYKPYFIQYSHLKMRFTFIFPRLAKCTIF